MKELTPVERLMFQNQLMIMRAVSHIVWVDGMSTMIQTTEAVLNLRKITEENARKLVVAFRA